MKWELLLLAFLGSVHRIRTRGTSACIYFNGDQTSGLSVEYSYPASVGDSIDGMALGQILRGSKRSLASVLVVLYTESLFSPLFNTWSIMTSVPSKTQLYIALAHHWER